MHEQTVSFHRTASLDGHLTMQKLVIVSEQGSIVVFKMHYVSCQTWCYFQASLELSRIIVDRSLLLGTKS